jgi:hypothetical protein
VKTSDLTGTKVSLTTFPLVGHDIRHRVLKFILGRDKSVEKMTGKRDTRFNVCPSLSLVSDTTHYNLFK